MMRDREEILRLASEALERYLAVTRKHEDDVADVDAAAAMLEVVVRFVRDTSGPTPILLLANRVLAEQRNLIPEVNEAAAERAARADIAVPNGGRPDMAEMMAGMRRALDEAYPERSQRKRRRREPDPPSSPKPLPPWCRGVIVDGSQD